MFKETYVATMGSDFVRKTVTVNKQEIELNLWTLSGQQCDVTTVPSVNFRFAAAVIIVFATDSPKSMEVIDQWKQKAEEIVAPDTIFILAANKCDMRRLNMRDLKDMAETRGYSEWMLTSAKTGEGVKEMFESAGKMVLAQSDANKGKKRTGIKMNPIRPNKPKSGCCLRS